MGKIKTNLQKYLKTLDEVIESKEGFYVWSYGELFKEFNDRLAKCFKLSVGQFASIIKSEKRFYSFKCGIKSHSYYIFVKSERTINAEKNI